ncbi:hypothetical protein AVW16_07035 [Crenobacter luteus]|uniref:Transporter n=2 Tax=Crenobacter luteus TaxID=1452487 RepID=A0A165FU83_9NEIS|nr:hypothetical protein AVW16_07035 [Crenobacter luteus]
MAGMQKKYRRLLGLTALCLGIAAPASAATFKDALDHAWAANIPLQTARTEQFDAQEQASRAWLPEPPTLSLSGRSDQIDRNKGMREWEAELGLPLWLWGQRDRAMRVAQREREAGESDFDAARWQLAGELREAWWEVRLAQTGLIATELKLKEARRLETDVARRVKAGDLAPYDLNASRGLLEQAKSELARAKTALLKAQEQFRTLSRGAALPDHDEPLAPEAPASGHPLLRSLIAKAMAARARLDQASADTRNTPELSFTLTRERGAFDEPYQNLATIGVKIPFGSASRNRPRIAIANAELAEAQLMLESTRRKLSALANMARAELAQSRETVARQQARLELAEQNFTWVDKAFRAGQLDLPSMIRAESELADARLQAARARTEASRAASRFNQAVGALP